MAESEIITIVLVHGACAESLSNWKPVLELLLAKGYNVVAAPNPLRGVSSDAAYVSSILNTIAGPIILVGHSYGGAVITNAAHGKAVAASRPAMRRVLSLSQNPGDDSDHWSKPVSTSAKASSAILI